MRPEVENRNKDSVFHGPYAGRDLYITMYQDSEREFVVTHNANVKPVSYFTGRETELKELRQRVEEGRKSVLVSGMGGIGKTHICRKLFEEYLNKHAEDGKCPFRHIGYVEYSGDMGSSLQSCLKFKQQDNPEQNQEAAWKELEYLASDGKLLLFVDNVDRLIGEDAGLQRLKGIPGAVVLTSRQASFSDEFEPYRIGFLGMEQCKEIYGKIRSGGSGKKIDPGEIEDLEYVIENLAGRHTITVELLAHLARTKLWTVKRLREELGQKGFRLTFHKDGELVNIQESYEKLYALSGLTEGEQNILEAFSVFPYIPLAAETCNEWLLADAGVSEDDDILMGLYQKGWLQFDADQEGYALHPVFAQFIYGKCKPTMEKHVGLIGECQRSLQVSKNGSTLIAQGFIPFAENIVERIGDMDQYGLLDALANMYEYIAEYEKSENLYEKLLKIHKHTVQEECLETARIYSDLASSCKNQEKYQKAEKIYKKSLEIYKKKIKENHPATLRTYMGLAVVYQGRGKYKKAKELFEKSLTISENEYGENHSATANIYTGLARLYEDQGEREKAEKLFIRSLEIFENVLGENHTKTAIGYNNLAFVYDCQGEYKIALDYCIKAFKILASNLGPESSYTQTVCENMKELYSVCNLKGNFDQWLEEQMKE